MSIELFTYDDAVQHLVDTFQFVDATLLGRTARRCVDIVYRDMPYRIQWRYYQRRETFWSSASQTSSTIVYDHTGGANERMVTIAAGTWPTWAQYGKIIISGEHYNIESRVSSTIITLREEDNPGADVAAGTSYTIYRNEYPLPITFRRGVRLYDVEDEREIRMAGFAESQAASVGLFDTPDQPEFAHIRNTGDHYGAWSVEFTPPPATARSYDLTYEAKPRDILTVSYATGTVATTGTAVTGTTTVFPTLCVGSVMRFGVSASGTAVTNKYGANPFTEQRVIVARGSDTSVTLDVAPTSDYSAGTAYQISDPIDIHPGAMTTAFLRAIELEWAKVRGLKDLPERVAKYDDAITLALESEPSNTYANASYGYDPRITWETES